MKKVRRALLTTLGMGIGWIAGITIMMFLMPMTGSSAFEMSFLEAMSNTLFFGFPGFMLFMIAIILSLREPKQQGLFEGNF